MFNSKFIKILCCIAICSICAVSLILIMLGISNAKDENSYSAVLIIIGLILPIFATISIYPLFALANIDDNLSSIKEKLNIPPEIKLPSRIESSRSEYTPTKKATPQKIISENPTLHLTDDLINFINERYCISLTLFDDTETIKYKIQNITEKPTTANMLIEKVMNANDMNEIISALIMHKVIYG